MLDLSLKLHVDTQINEAEQLLYSVPLALQFIWVMNLYSSCPLHSSVPQHAIRELHSPLIGLLSLLPVFGVQWAPTLSDGGVLMAASDRVIERGCRHFSVTPLPLLVLAFLGCSPWCGFLDEPRARLLQENKMSPGVTTDRCLSVSKTLLMVWKVSMTWIKQCRSEGLNVVSLISAVQSSLRQQYFFTKPTFSIECYSMWII